MIFLGRINEILHKSPQTLTIDSLYYLYKDEPELKQRLLEIRDEKTYK